MPYDLLESMYHQNPWWDSPARIEEDIHIQQLKKTALIFKNSAFLSHPFTDGVYIVTGPRQIGKTTHLKLLIQKKITQETKENFLYFNCDILDAKKDIVELVEKYLKENPSKGRKFIFLDEITAVKDSILAVKYLIDAGKKQNITYILTGSSTVGIQKTGEFLPGRRGKGRDFVFLPMSFKKYLMARHPKQEIIRNQRESLGKFYLRLQKEIPLQRELQNYLICGGIPRIINDYSVNQEITLDNYTLYRDWIISETAKNGKREAIVKLMLERIMASVGSEASYNAFASDTGIASHNTVYEYLHFLEEAFCIRQIYQYSYREKKIYFRKNKKIYLRDPFLFWLLLWWLGGEFRAYLQRLKESEFTGRMMENIAFLHLESIFSDIFFYRNAGEIDFIGLSEKYNFGNENAKVRAKTAKADEGYARSEAECVFSKEKKRHSLCSCLAAEPLHLQSKGCFSESPTHKNIAFECKYQKGRIAPADVKELLRFPGVKWVITRDEFSEFSKGKEYRCVPMGLFLMMERGDFEEK